MIRRFAPSGPLVGSTRVPGDKSISHRALLLGAMGKGPSKLEGLGTGADVASTISSLKMLGTRVDLDTHAVIVSPNGWDVLPGAYLDCGNSGTTMRLLMGALAPSEGSWELAGDASLSRRPMERVAAPLRQMGAKIELTSGTPPVYVTGGRLAGIVYELEVASAQVKGAILLAALKADGQTRIVERLPTRDHTERLLRWLSVPCSSEDGITVISGHDALFEHDGFNMMVPGDLSSAAYLIAAAILVEGSSITIDGVGINPTRVGFIDAVRNMGASIEIQQESDDPEPTGTIRASSSSLRAINIGPEQVPLAIDELPLIALLATQAEGTTEITGASELRVKESDRISATVRGLSALGAQVEQTDDGLVVTGPTALTGGSVDTHGDHRMALTFAIAGLIASEPVEISGWEASSVSYPSFEEDITRLIS